MDFGTTFQAIFMSDRIYYCLLFQILVEPVEEYALPEHTILWLCHPVAFIREVEELGWYATHASCIEGLHTLSHRNAEVVFVVDDEYRSVLFGD